MMNKIVAISDTHLGQSGTDTMGQYSLLSSRSPNNLIREFAHEAGRFADGEKVALVVVGDFLDLSLSYVEDALHDLRDLLKALPPSQVSEIVWDIGNHDIEAWGLHCEEKNILTALRAGKIPANDLHDPTSRAIYKVTPNSGEPFTLMQPLIDEIYGPGNVSIKIAYPSYVVEIDEGPLCYFAHSHLVSKFYTEISDLLADKLAEFPHDRVAATVNQPLLGLIYWLLGEMGEGMGADGFVEQVYTDLQRGDGSQIKKIVERLVAQLLPNGIVNGIPDAWERSFVVDKVLAKLRDILPDKSKAGSSKDRFGDLGKTIGELETWIKTVSPLKERWSDLDHPTIVVSGHTHTPFLSHRFANTSVTAWNLGTWLIEPGHDAPRTGFLGIDRRGATLWVDVK